MPEQEPLLEAFRSGLNEAAREIERLLGEVPKAIKDPAFRANLDPTNRDV